MTNNLYNTLSKALMKSSGSPAKVKKRNKYTMYIILYMFKLIVVNILTAGYSERYIWPIRCENEKCKITLSNSDNTVKI